MPNSESMSQRVYATSFAAFVLLSNAGVDLESDSAYSVVFNEIDWALEEMEKLI